MKFDRIINAIIATVFLFRKLQSLLASYWRYCNAKSMGNRQASTLPLVQCKSLNWPVQFSWVEFVAMNTALGKFSGVVVEGKEKWKGRAAAFPKILDCQKSVGKSYYCAKIFV